MPVNGNAQPFTNVLSPIELTMIFFKEQKYTTTTPDWPEFYILVLSIHNHNGKDMDQEAGYRLMVSYH